MSNKTLQFGAATNDVDAAKALATELGGTAYIDDRPGASKLPFRALLVATTDDFDIISQCGELGTYTLCQRIIKPGGANYYGLFPLIHHPDLTHKQSDDHWRDNHGPLALEHHIHMTHYVQLAVVQHHSGLDVDGFALCGFETEDDLRNRFYTTKESVQVIANDVNSFAAVNKSPRRLIAQPYSG